MMLAEELSASCMRCVEYGDAGPAGCQTYEAGDHVEHVDEREGHDAARDAPLQLRARDRVADRRDEGHLQQRDRERVVEAVQREQRLRANSGTTWC